MNSSPTGEFTVGVPLRWVDSDPGGHATTAAVLDYLQEARVSFLLQGPNAHLLGTGIIVVGHDVEFTAPVVFARDPLEVSLRIGGVGPVRFTVAYEAHQGGRLVLRARTGVASFDAASGRPRRFTPEERAWFAGQAGELEPWSGLPAYRVGAQAHRHPVTVRWSDVDRFGHVNNTRYFDYFAEARLALYAQENPEQPDLAGRPWVLVRQDIQYRRQLVHRAEPFVVRTAVADVGRTAVTLSADLVDPLADETMATATTVLVHVGADGRPAPVPDSVAAVAARWPAEAVRSGPARTDPPEETA